MSDPVDNLVIEHLSAIRTELREVRDEQPEQRVRLVAIERTVAHIERDNAEFRAEIGGRFDRIHDRLDRIESRLELSPAR
jgi:hypothetical protein